MQPPYDQAEIHLALSLQAETERAFGWLAEAVQPGTAARFVLSNISDAAIQA